MPPYKLSGTTVVSFSGGRTSAYMLRQVLVNNEDLSDLVVTFANTVVDYPTASRQGEPFEALIRKRKYLPNPVTRFCTIDLKIRIIHKYLRGLGLSTEEAPVDMMTGIRADEPRRVVKIRHRKSTSESKWATMVMPLADAGVGVQDVTDFWSGQPFDLMLPTINGRTLEGNCDLCFLKGAKQVYSIIASDRHKAEWWARMESSVVSGGKFTGDGARFRSDRPSYQQMLDTPTPNSICSQTTTRPLPVSAVTEV
jgi:hypothetical protein